MEAIRFSSGLCPEFKSSFPSLSSWPKFFFKFKQPRQWYENSTSKYMLEAAFDLCLAWLSYMVVPLKNDLSPADILQIHESRCLEIGLQVLGDLWLYEERCKAHRRTQDHMRFPVLLLFCGSNSVYSDKKWL